ncbi:hypothetical protein FJW07_27525 [Mesorhizobium sp. B3-1-9]|nr:hypothetical protein FJW07_27525 [Mesorhizobium sp. B3-1-9]
MLASLTKPGPFTPEALSLGDFWGIRIDGRLAVMAGERMRQPGCPELSGVCTHPDFRVGGRRLSVFVAGRIAARGEVAYLHAYDSNAAAIGLYESIGFRLRNRMNMAMARSDCSASSSTGGARSAATQRTPEDPFRDMRGLQRCRILLRCAL